jgi:hypothetical protein
MSHVDVVGLGTCYVVNGKCLISFVVLKHWCRSLRLFSGLVNSCLRNMPYCVDAESSMYFALAVESATKLCSLLPQAMEDPHIIDAYHGLDLRASPSPKEESCHMSRCDGSFPLEMGERWRVLER